MIAEAERELERLTAERVRLEGLTDDLRQDLSAFLAQALERLGAEATDVGLPSNEVASDVIEAEDTLVSQLSPSRTSSAARTQHRSPLSSESG